MVKDSAASLQRTTAPVTPWVSPATSHSAAPDGKFYDFEHHSYGSGVAPAGASSHIPIQVDGDSTTDTIHVVRLTFQALIDTGATAMSLPETAVEELLGSGVAVGSDTITVRHANTTTRTLDLRTNPKGNNVHPVATTQSKSSVRLYGAPSGCCRVGQCGASLALRSYMRFSLPGHITDGAQNRNRPRVFMLRLRGAHRAVAGNIFCCVTTCGAKQTQQGEGCSASPTGTNHEGSDGSSKFIFDLMEPERPKVDRVVLDFVRAHVFDPADFVIRSDGVCRLNPEMARMVVARIST
jgi:hypothetical protein